MPFNGNGTFVRLHNWTFDAANGVDINAGEMDAEDNGFASGLSNAVTRDGQGKMAADFTPATDNVYNLGTGALRWATLNGVPTPSTNQNIGKILYPQTALESSLGITPTNYFYPPRGPLQVFRYGAAGDGVTDDTAVIQSALTVVAGGKLIIPANLPSGTAPAKFLVGNITVPANTAIVGEIPYPTILLTTAGLQVNPYNLGSQLRLEAGATITLNDGSAIQDALVIHAGLSLPATTNSQATTLLTQFADTAITATSASVRLERIMVLGFNRLTFITNPGGVSLSSRTVIRDVMGDCNNGIYVTDSADVSHFSGCHMFPFLTFATTGVSAANLQRPGSAYYFGNVDDWFTVFDCFSYAYAVGFECVDTSAVAFLRCQTDYTSTGGGTNAFLVTYSAAHSEYISIIDCQSIGYLKPVLIVTGPAPTGNDTIQLANNKFIYAAGGVGVEVSSGYLLASDNLIQGAGTAIQLDAGCTGADIHDNRIVGAVTALANAATGAVVARNNPGLNPVGTSQATHLVGASPLTYTAGTAPETIYASASTSISSATLGGHNILPAATAAVVTLNLEPNESTLFAYTGTLTITTDAH